MTAVTPQQLKLLEQLTDESGVSYLEMMENAGRGLAEAILEKTSDNLFTKVLFLCGNGNNAGDCFVAARLLDRKGIECTVALLCGEPKTDISCRNLELIENTNVIVLRDHDLIKQAVTDIEISIIADGVFGTGFHGELPQKIQQIFSLCSYTEAYIVAVDVPSGGNCLTGAAADGTLSADETVTFGRMKFGMTQSPLKEYCGNITLKDIDIPISAERQLVPEIWITESESISYIMPSKAADINKSHNGRLLVICGSDTMPGACVMAVGGALRSGAGLVQVASTPFVTQMIASRYPEAMIQPLKTPEGYLTEDNLDEIVKLSQKATAVLIGCGMGTAEGTKALIKKLIQNISCPKIIDADGINCIADSIDIIKDKGQETILTPHPGEMGRLLGKTAKEVQSDRLAAVTELKDKTGAVCVLKGAGTLIAHKDAVWVNQTGNSGMAKGGSGDVLAGIIASLTAQGMPLQNSASAGVYLHGLAGDIAAEKYTKQCMTATDIIECLPEAFKSAGIE